MQQLVAWLAWQWSHITMSIEYFAKGGSDTVNTQSTEQGIN
jgi:hypothetical protein